MSLFVELKRRNVFRVGIAYLVVAWLALQVVDVILNNLAVPDWVFQVVLSLFAIGFPIAVTFAWVFELTPDGLKLEREVDRSRSITGETAHKLDRVIIATLVLAVAYFSYDKFVLDPARDAALLESATRPETAPNPTGGRAASEEPSIAVLPFVNMSSDAEQEYFADGLSEELLNLLAKIPTLKVAARTSSFSLKDKNLQIAEVGDILKVSHVLEGSVRKSGERVRITAQLIHASDGFHLWSDTWDRTLDDVFAIQDEIAAAVVEQLKVSLLGASPKTEAIDPEAYALYLQARALAHQGSEASWLKSRQLIEQALEIAPDFPEGWVHLARIYSGLASSYQLPLEEGKREAFAAIDRALAINPDFGPAHALRASIYIGDDDLVQGAEHLARALQLDARDSYVLGVAGSLAGNLGRHDLSTALGEYLLSIDPANPSAHRSLGIDLMFAGRYAEARRACEKALELSPGIVNGHRCVGFAQLQLGNAEAALAAWERETDEEYAVKGQAMSLYTLGRMDEFQQKLDELVARWGEQWPSEIAHVYAYMGDVDTAFEWLDRAVAQDEEGLAHQFLFPYYRSLHGDPRWQQFRERTGTAQAFLDTIPLEVSVPR